MGYSGAAADSDGEAQCLLRECSRFCFSSRFFSRYNNSDSIFSENHSILICFTFWFLLIYLSFLLLATERGNRVEVQLIIRIEFRDKLDWMWRNLLC